jgi:DNA-binding transcriptional LysR family regulator
MLKEVVSNSLRIVTVAEQHLSMDKTVLRMGILPSIGPVRLAPFLARFTNEHFGVELTLVEAPLPRLEDLLLRSNLDAAVVAYVGHPDKRFRYCSLYQERIVIVAPKGHRLEKVETVRLHDLENEKLLLRTNCDMGDFFLQSCRKEGFEPQIIYRSGREDWVQAMVASGYVVTIMPEFTHTGVATIARPLVDPDFVRQLSLVTVAKRRQEPSVTALIRAIRAYGWYEENAPHDPERRSLILRSKWPRSMPSTEPYASERASP